MDAIERLNEDNLMRLLETMYGGPGKVWQLSMADHDGVAGPFKKNNGVSLVDPVDCEKMLTGG